MEEVAVAGEFMAVKTGTEFMGMDAGVECRNSMDSPTVWRMEEGGCCRGVHGYEDRRGVPRQDSNPDSLLRLGLPNSVEESGSCRGVDGGGAGVECRDTVQILTPSYALDSPTVWRKAAAAGESMGAEAGVECRDTVQILTPSNALDSSTVRLQLPGS